MEAKLTYCIHKTAQSTCKICQFQYNISYYTPIQNTLETPNYQALAEQAKQSTASKNDKEKVDLSLIPYISQLEHAKAFMVGEKKYGRYNYTKGHKASQLVAAMLRHATAYFNGEDYDPVDGQHHLGSVMACCSMLLRQTELGTLTDDRFKPETK